MQLIDLEYQSQVVKESDVLELFAMALGNEDLSVEQKAAFSRRKVEFLEDFGSSVERQVM